MQKHEEDGGNEDSGRRAVAVFDWGLHVATKSRSSQMPADAADTTAAIHFKGREGIKETS
jgi:hypothetical protein